MAGPVDSEAPGLRASSSGGALRDQLAETWGALTELVDDCSPEDWQAPTACPGWTVADQVAHVVGTERLLLGEAAPERQLGSAPHVRNDIGRFNEQWVLHYREAGTAALVADLKRVTAARLDVLGEMDEAAFDAPSWTPVGHATYRRFMQIRVFDCYVHELDVRDALGRPGHQEGAAVEQALDEVVRALGVIVGKRVGAPEGSSIRFHLAPPAGRTLEVAVQKGRARLVPEAAPPATATLTLGALDFLRLACGRQAPAGLLAAGRITLEGDSALAQRVLEHLAFTI